MGGNVVGFQEHLACKSGRRPGARRPHGAHSFFPQPHDTHHLRSGAARPGWTEGGPNRAEGSRLARAARMVSRGASSPSFSPSTPALMLSRTRALLISTSSASANSSGCRVWRWVSYALGCRSSGSCAPTQARRAHAQHRHRPPSLLRRGNGLCRTWSLQSPFARSWWVGRSTPGGWDRTGREMGSQVRNFIKCLDLWLPRKH